MAIRFVAFLLTVAICAESRSQSPEEPPKQPTAAPAAAAEKPVIRKNPIPTVATLALRVRELSLQDMPLDQVIELLRSITSANIVVQWDRLKDMGIERDTPISFHVRNLKVSQILWLIMSHAPLSDVKLAYRADRDMILISTEQALGSEMIVKLYDVQELIMARISRPTIAIGRVHEVVTSVNANVAEGAVGFTPVTTNYGSGVIVEGEDTDGTTDPEDDEARATEGEREERMRQLVALIQQTVEPDSWTVNGGRGVIIPWRGHIVVRNTIAVHERLGGPVAD